MPSLKSQLYVRPVAPDATTEAEKSKLHPLTGWDARPPMIAGQPQLATSTTVVPVRMTGSQPCARTIVAFTV